MKETLSKVLSDYVNQRGGAPVNLADPAVAAELAELLAAAVPAQAPAPEPDKTEGQ